MSQQQASAFDPAVYEQQVTEDASSTSVTPVPGGEYVAIIKDYKFRTITQKKSGEQSLMCDVLYFIQDDTGSLKSMIDRDPIVTHGYFCDTKTGPDSKEVLDFGKGKNVWLGKLREALNQNTPGIKWSFPMLRGAVCKIVVIEDPAKDDPETIYNRVKSVGRLV